MRYQVQDKYDKILFKVVWHVKPNNLILSYLPNASWGQGAGLGQGLPTVRSYGGPGCWSTPRRLAASAMIDAHSAVWG